MPASILVVTKSRDDVFDGLFFQGLPAELKARVRLLEFGHDALTPALADAAAVIVMRHGLFSFGHLTQSAGWAGVPRYYFLDDNLMALGREPGVEGRYWSAYTSDRVRRALTGFAGVMLATQPLMHYFAEHALHPHLIEYPPIAWPILRARGAGGNGDAAWRRAPGEPFRIAFFGGEHRRRIFADIVFPAVQRLAVEMPVELVLAGIDPTVLPAPAAGLRLVALPYELRYGVALADLSRHQIDVVVHPAQPSGNNPYKNANVLINARSIGAVPVLSRLPPYDALGSPCPAILCENNADAWFAALSSLTTDPDQCARVFERTCRYCEEHFSGRANAEAIERILAAHQAPDRLQRTARCVVAGPLLGLDRSVERAKNVARRSTLLRDLVRHARGGAVC